MNGLWRGWPLASWQIMKAPTAGAVLAAGVALFHSPAASLAQASLQGDEELPAASEVNSGGAALGVTLSDDANGAVKVAGVMPNSPAAEAGIRPADRILAINEEPVATSSDVIYLVGSMPPGRKVTIRIDRGGLQGALRATLLSRREVNQRAALGVTLSRGTAGSVRVLAVVPNSPAAKAGVKMGDRITAVNDEPVAGYKDVIRLLGDDQPGDRVRLKVDRYGLQGTLLATLEGGQQVFQAPAPIVLPRPRPAMTEEDLLFRNTPAQIDDQRGYGD
jgi:S1-C subfamily serine protease